jgi:hypothetical protein
VLSRFGVTSMMSSSWIAMGRGV